LVYYLMIKKLKMEVKEKDGEQVTEVTSSKGSVTQTRIKMAEHDTVGIYYNSTLKIVNFIKDGHPLGSTIEGVPEDVVPQIGIKENSKIAFNFGSAPFKFDLNAFCRALDVETPSNFIELGNLNRSNWKKTMKKEMVLRYRGALDPKEVHKKYNIMGDVDLSLLVRRLASITGITFSERVEKSVNKDFVLLPTDVVLLTPTLRHMGIIEYAKAVEILYKVQSKDSTDKSAKKTAKTILLLEDSKNMLEAAIAKLPLASPTYQFYLGEVLSELSKASPKSADSYRAQAFASYEEAIRLVNERTEKFETDLTYFHILQDAQLRSADLFLTGLFQDKTKPWHAYLNHSEFGSAQKRYAELGRYGHSERAYQEFNDLALKVDMTNNPLAMTQLYLKSKILFHLINQSDKESIKDAAAETYFKILRKAISFHQKEKTKGQHLFSPTEWNPNTKDHMNEIQQIWSSWAKTPKTKQRILSQIFESSIHGHELAVLIHICQSELKLLITALDKTESMQQKIKFGSEIMNELIKKMISQEPEAVRAIEIKLKHIQQTPLEADFSNMVGFYVDFQTEPPKPFDPLAAQKAKEAEKEKAAREQEEKKEKRAKSKKEKQEKEAERLRQEAEKVAEAKRAAEEREKAAATAHKKEKKAQSERGSRRSIQTVEEKERPEKPAIKQKSQIVALEDGLKNIASPQKPRPGQVKMAEAEVQLNKAPPSKQKEEKEKTIFERVSSWFVSSEAASAPATPVPTAHSPVPTAHSGSRPARDDYIDLDQAGFMVEAATITVSSPERSSTVGPLSNSNMAPRRSLSSPRSQPTAIAPKSELELKGPVINTPALMLKSDIPAILVSNKQENESMMFEDECGQVMDESAASDRASDGILQEDLGLADDFGWDRDNLPETQVDMLSGFNVAFDDPSKATTGGAVFPVSITREYGAPAPPPGARGEPPSPVIQPPTEEPKRDEGPGDKEKSPGAPTPLLRARKAPLPGAGDASPVSDVTRDHGAPAPPPGAKGPPPPVIQPPTEEPKRDEGPGDREKSLMVQPTTESPKEDPSEIKQRDKVETDVVKKPVLAATPKPMPHSPRTAPAAGPVPVITRLDLAQQIEMEQFNVCEEQQEECVPAPKDSVEKKASFTHWLSKGLSRGPSDSHKAKGGGGKSAAESKKGDEKPSSPSSIPSKKDKGKSGANMEYDHLVKTNAGAREALPGSAGASSPRWKDEKTKSSKSADEKDKKSDDKDMVSRKPSGKGHEAGEQRHSKNVGSEDDKKSPDKKHKEKKSGSASVDSAASKLKKKSHKTSEDKKMSKDEPDAPQVTLHKPSPAEAERSRSGDREKDDSDPVDEQDSPVKQSIPERQSCVMIAISNQKNYSKLQFLMNRHPKQHHYLTHILVLQKNFLILQNPADEGFSRMTVSTKWSKIQVRSVITSFIEAINDFIQMKCFWKVNLSDIWFQDGLIKFEIPAAWINGNEVTASQMKESAIAALKTMEQFNGFPQDEKSRLSVEIH